MNTCGSKFTWIVRPTLSMSPWGLQPCASHYWQMISFLTLVRSLSLISNSHRCLLISSSLLHSPAHLYNWQFLGALLSAFLPSQWNMGCPILSSWLNPFESSELSSLTTNQSADLFSTLPSPNTPTLSLHPHLLQRPYPTTNLSPLLSEGILTRNYRTHFRFYVKVLAAVKRRCAEGTCSE